MKALILHCSKFHYKKEWQIPGLEEFDVDSGLNTDTIDSAMSVFLAIEEGDNDSKINKAAKEFRKLAKKMQANIIIINPFAHLTSTRASPEVASSLSTKIVDRLRNTSDCEIKYTSFGWYKSYEISVLSHNNSQLFREF